MRILNIVIKLQLHGIVWLLVVGYGSLAWPDQHCCEFEKAIETVRDTVKKGDKPFAELMTLQNRYVDCLKDLIAGQTNTTNTWDAKLLLAELDLRKSINTRSFVGWSSSTGYASFRNRGAKPLGLYGLQHIWTDKDAQIGYGVFVAVNGSIAKGEPADYLRCGCRDQRSVPGRCTPIQRRGGLYDRQERPCGPGATAD